ncbi:MAG: hypothetical protein CMQ20_02345 [Gammaproteobacteria bacterium]|jgi:DNA repair exonuclease SbcCD nuclease subunit|nr:hypothetical protein [Gammaproteobacteria bacterium]|tara:strand:+ start:3249 stop:3998 length:750 start_codon:yes stop_codon:yes gene_type:complete
MRRRPLKLIHTSDLHISSEGRWNEDLPLDRPREERALSEVIDTALRRQADLLLIAGDLFDSSRVAGAQIDFVMKEFSRASCPIILIPGNHDCYDDHSIYKQVDFEQAGSHVKVLMSEEGQTLEFPKLEATVWGRALIDHDHKNQPLADIPKRSGDFWHLGIAHGYLTQDRSEMRSSLITHEEIGESGLDYLALGHVHVFREVSQNTTTACYSGSPAPGFLGDGQWGSVAMVTLDQNAGVILSEEKLRVN